MHVRASSSLSVHLEPLHDQPHQALFGRSQAYAFDVIKPDIDVGCRAFWHCDQPGRAACNGSSRQNRARAARMAVV